MSKMIRYGYFLSITASIFLTLYTNLLAGESPYTTDNLKWQEAAADIDTLPFKESFIDSLKNVYKLDSQTALRNLGKKPAIKNETLVYQVSWGPINAGNVILTTQYDSSKNVVQIGGKAMSSNFVSAFYKMRDYVLSTIDATGLYPIFFQQHLREGKRYKNDGWILYDVNGSKIHSHLKKDKQYDTPQFTHDYLSILYYLRSINLTPGDTFTLNIFVDSKIHPIRVNCKEKVPVQTELGKFNCLVVEPSFTGDGQTFTKKDKIEILLSEGLTPTPILIKSKFKVGFVTARLVWRNQNT